MPAATNFVRGKTTLWILIVFSLTVPGCTNIGPTGSVYTTPKTYVQFINLPKINPKGESKTKYKDPNKTGTVLYDTKGQKAKQLSPYFTVSEFTHSGDTSFRYARINKKLVNCLANIRAYFGAPININSSYRSWQYNNKLIRKGLKASKKSYHMSGAAADFSVKGVAITRVADIAYKLCGCGIGVGVANQWMHIDVRGYSTRPWGYSKKNLENLKSARYHHRKQCGKGRRSDEESIFGTFINEVKPVLNDLEKTIEKFLKF